MRLSLAALASTGWLFWAASVQAGTPESGSLFNPLLKEYEQLLRGQRYPEAVEAAAKTAAAAEHEFGSNSGVTGAAYYSLGALLFRLDQQTNARVHLERALKIYEQAYGPKHTNTTTAAAVLGTLCLTTGEYSNAAFYLERSVQGYDNAPGFDRAASISVRTELGAAYMALGYYARAGECLTNTLKLSERFFGPSGSNTANVLCALGSLCGAKGDLVEAQAYCRRALEILESKFGLGHDTTLQALLALAVLYDRAGRFTQAEALHQRALQSLEGNGAVERQLLGMELCAFGEHCTSTGRYAEADTSLKRALRLAEQSGADSIWVSGALHNLGVLYAQIGDQFNAAGFLEQALKLRWARLGPGHPATAATINCLGIVQQRMGQQTNAFQLYMSALKTFADAGRTNDPVMVPLLMNLAELYQQQRDYTNALLLLLPALRIATNSLSKWQPQFAELVHKLGSIYTGLGNPSMAEELLLVAWRLFDQAQGPDHPDTVSTLSDLSLVLLEQGLTAQALADARRAQAQGFRAQANLFSFASERQRLSFRPNEAPLSVFAATGSAHDLALAVLRHKGAILDSILEDRLLGRVSDQPRFASQLEELRVAKRRVTQLQLEWPENAGPTEQENRRRTYRAALEQVQQLEGALAREVTGLGQARKCFTVTVEQVQAAIPPGAALIEFLRYPYYLGRSRFQARYGAVVVVPYREPLWVCLGDADRIDDDIRQYQRGVRRSISDAQFNNILRTLSDEVWSPIATNLPPQTRVLIVSPDGQFNFVSLVTLLGANGRFLGETYSVRYTASGRDILRHLTQSSSSNLVIFARPSFVKATLELAGERQSTSGLIRSAAWRGLGDVFLSDLPGTEREALVLGQQATDWGWPVTVYLGVDASEAHLRALSAPHILHLATHGLFLPPSSSQPGARDSSAAHLNGSPSLLLDADTPQARPVVLFSGMERSGLALAGAQTTLSAWGKGQIPPPDDDGILTAEEAGALKLQGAWLVVLSACETGLGEAAAGEGVMGLRRGFIQAGAQNLLMALWNLQDEITVRFMSAFYEAAHTSGNAAKALAQVQRDWLLTLREKTGTAEAARVAGPFILSSQGPPQ